jgi:endonuclease I
MLLLRSLLVLLLVASAAAAQPEQIVLFPDEQGDELRASIIAAYKPTSVLSEAAGKDRMYDTIWATEVEGDEGVVGVYTGFFVPFDCDPNCDPSQDVFNQGSENTQGINQEHIWPRAEGVDGTQAERDLHHLAPTFVRANGDRGNLPFAEIPDAQTDTWYIDNTVTSTMPTTNIDAYSERDVNTAFEPREDFKGDVARSMFYVATMYADLVDLDFFEAQVETLRLWHELDDVDDAEYDRTFVIAGFQGGDDRENPFVLDSTLVRRAFFPTPPVDAEASPLADGFALSSAYPNPFASATTFTLRVSVPQRITVEAFDVLGRRVAVLHDGPVPSDAPLRLTFDAATLPAGLYVVRATGETVRATRRITLSR